MDKGIQTVIDQDRIKYHLPALSVGLKLPGENFVRNYVGGYYSLSTKDEILSSTLFQIGSITKTFIAAIVLQLAETNKLNLDDKLGKWLPEYPRWKKITIRNLISHTSGVYNYTHGKSFDNSLRNNPGKYWSLSELVNIAYQHADLFKPGYRYQYTNTDYVLLGLIIEKVTNKKIQEVFDQFLHEYQLKNTYYTPAGYPTNVMNRMAHGYNRDDTFTFNKDVTFISMSFAQSA
ncbi:MAG: serine hydrolase domain-containing protein, partial [Gammaproteobacteria bacterium]